jgi:hypothetical protein
MELIYLIAGPIEGSLARVTCKGWGSARGQAHFAVSSLPRGTILDQPVAEFAAREVAPGFPVDSRA